MSRLSLAHPKESVAFRLIVVKFDVFKNGLLELADEPTANIDTRHPQQVVDLIRETCREENVALVLVTYTSEVAKQFDRVENLENINLINAGPAK